MLITLKAKLVTAPKPPFVGTRIGIALDDPGSLTWGIFALTLAEGHAGAVVDWGDGTCTELAESGQPTHDYAKAGEYEILISDDVSSLRCSTKSATSEFRTVYAPMIREFRTTAAALRAIADCCFHDATSLRAFQGAATGPHTLGQRAFYNCKSLSGRLDLPGAGDIASTAFSGCSGITELHFASANEDAIRASPAWKESGGRFGAENAAAFFDL